MSSVQIQCPDCELKAVYKQVVANSGGHKTGSVERPLDDEMKRRCNHREEFIKTHRCSVLEYAIRTARGS